MAIVVPDNSNPDLEVEVLTIVPTPSDSGHNKHKNYLQEYTQRSGVPLPSYSTFSEGEPHVPKFRATVVVDGMSITSPNTFSHRKESEQDVARIALECVLQKFKNECSYYIHKDPMFCKLILNEYSTKLKLDKPTYNTTQQKGIVPIFSTTVTFNGKTYVGFVGKNKKEAEQNAACTAIDSILANSNDGIVMAQIIKTKGRLYAAVNNDAKVGKAVLQSGIEIDGANDVNRRSEVVAVPTNDVAQSSQVNYQIPYFGLPTTVDSQAIIHKKRNKRSKKKRQGGQSKRVRVDEQASATMDQVKNELEE